MNKKERDILASLKEYKIMLTATAFLMLIIALASCKVQAAPPTASGSHQLAKPPVTLQVSETAISGEVIIPKVDHFLVGSSSFKDIADWLYQLPDTVRDDRTMNFLGSNNETDVFNSGIVNKGIYVHGRFGQKIDGQDGALTWLNTFCEKRVDNYWQPKEIENLFGNEYRELSYPELARASANNTILLIKQELIRFPNSNINLHIPWVTPWENPKNRETYLDQLGILLREEYYKEPLAYSRIHLYDLDPIVRFNKNPYRTPYSGERGLTHLRYDLVPDLLKMIIEKPYEISWR